MNDIINKNPYFRKLQNAIRLHIGNDCQIPEGYFNIIDFLQNSMHFCLCIKIPFDINDEDFIKLPQGSMNQKS